MQLSEWITAETDTTVNLVVAKVFPLSEVVNLHLWLYWEPSFHIVFGFCIPP